MTDEELRRLAQELRRVANHMDPPQYFDGEWLESEPPPERVILLDLIEELRYHYPRSDTMLKRLDRAEARLREVTSDE